MDLIQTAIMPPEEGTAAAETPQPDGGSARRVRVQDGSGGRGETGRLRQDCPRAVEVMPVLQTRGPVATPRKLCGHCQR